MTRYETEALNAIIHHLPRISKALENVASELKKANDLKALELKSNSSLTPEMVDAAIDGE